MYRLFLVKIISFPLYNYILHFYQFCSALWRKIKNNRKIRIYLVPKIQVVNLITLHILISSDFFYISVSYYIHYLYVFFILRAFVSAHSSDQQRQNVPITIQIIRELFRTRCQRAYGFFTDCLGRLP